MMIQELLPFTITLDKVLLAGASLWALALYLGFSSVRQWVEIQLNRWFNFADRSLYTPTQYEESRRVREAQNSFYASVCGIIPFLGVGLLCNYGMELSLGRSWAVSLGMIACLSCGIYELGRRSGEIES